MKVDCGEEYEAQTRNHNLDKDHWNYHRNLIENHTDIQLDNQDKNFEFSN